MARSPGSTFGRCQPARSVRPAERGVRSLARQALWRVRLACSCGIGLGSALACTPEPELEIVAVRELDPLPVPDTVAAWTRGYSLFAFGRAVWLFGDTQLRAPDAAGSTLRSSSWGSTSDLAADDGVNDLLVPEHPDGGPALLLPLTAEELAFDLANLESGARTVLWPMTGIRDDAGDRVLLFYAKLQANGAGALTPVGTGVAVWTELELGPVRPVLDAGNDEPTLLFRAPEPAFGQAALLVGDQLYAYACRDELYRPCMLARVAVTDLFEREAWTFWTGRGWSPSLAEAVDLVEADTVLSVAYNPEVGRYLMVHADPTDAELQLRSAPAPEGPWSEPLTVLRPQMDGAVTEVLAHPEYRRGGGQFELLSYRADDELRLVQIELARP